MGLAICDPKDDTFSIVDLNGIDIGIHTYPPGRGEGENGLMEEGDNNVVNITGRHN